MCLAHARSSPYWACCASVSTQPSAIIIIIELQIFPIIEKVVKHFTEKCFIGFLLHRSLVTCQDVSLDF